MRIKLGLVTATIGAMLGAVGGMPSASAAAYPVPYTFAADIAAAPTGPDAPPPGANDWSCRPSAAHPDPVVLVHGLFATQTDDWQTYGPLLANHGYCVFSLTYGNQPSAPFPADDFGGMPAMEQSATVLDAFVDRVRAATGARKVDLVGHSEGATMPYWYLRFGGGAAKVARMVGLAPAVHGTAVAGTSFSQVPAAYGLPSQAQVESFCPACSELAAGSDFMRRLDAGRITAPGVAYTQIVTRYDELVVPYTSGIVDEPGATNIVVQHQCGLDLADHLAIVADPVAAQDVLNALDPAHPRRVPCVPVVPAVG
ncbi:MAG: alpha/beta fold hydrolase [Nocardioides sp.]|nr:alpha/beta fold hydrolase [Nocardioides sp.]